MFLWTAATSVGLTILGCKSTPTNAERTATLQANGLGATTLPSTDRRVGMVFSGHGFHFSHESRDFHGAAGPVHVQMYAYGTSNGDAGWRGSVAAIDRRGYFLTAAHAVGRDPIWVCCGGAMRPARVVFRGDEDFDVAVLSIDRPIPDAFRWAEPGRYPTGTLVLECGPTDPRGNYSPLALLAGHVSMQLFAGRVGGVDPETGGDGPYEVVTSSLPARPGDSGGPVMTRDGELVAIFVKFDVFGPRSYAVRPNPSWVRDVVEQDYTAYRSTPPSTVPTSRPAN